MATIFYISIPYINPLYYMAIPFSNAIRPGFQAALLRIRAALHGVGRRHRQGPVAVAQPGGHGVHAGDLVCCKEISMQETESWD